MLKFTLLVAFIFSSFVSPAQTVTGLQGFYRSGQVFLTWNNISNGTAYYKVYRSGSPITSAGQLLTCEYLGYTNSASSVNHNLTNHDGIVRYLRIDSAGIPLSSSTGLFVATTLVNGNYYYAVTTLISNAENTTIISGSNSLALSITETVSRPMPVFQQVKLVGPYPANVYTTFISSKYAVGQPLLLNAGFVPMDFAVNLNNATGNNPVRFFFHGGGDDYLENIEITDTNEVRIQIEDYFPDSTINDGWLGTNPAYDIYADVNNVPPTTGINNNYGQRRISDIIDWVIHHLPIDSNRIYFDGTSDGSAPAFLYAITYPDRLAAVEVHVGAFDLAFENDWLSNCSLNSGKKNRKDLDDRFGTVSTNLLCNLGPHTYDALNGDWVIHQYEERNYPFIYSVNGKQDKQTGWTEKTIWYDSVNANHFGGWYFWDNRDHGGNIDKTWGDENFSLYRFKRNASYPAFSHCTLNEDYGDGNGTTGANHGTVSGALNWNDNITDEALSWSVKVFVRNLLDKNKNVIVYPDSCTADITPHRLQHFSVPAGTTINWQVKHHAQTIQSGSFTYNGGLIVIPQVKIFKDTSTLLLSISGVQTFYHDGDLDGYGDPAVSVVAAIQPPGYVLDNTDCNDQNSQVHPGANDICNSIDDNCNNLIDENSITATVTPSGTVTLCKGLAITLSANTGTGFTYQWKKGSSIISGETHATYTTTKNEGGSFSVVISNGYSCSSASAATTIARLDQPNATITPLGNLDICQTGQVSLQANGGSGLTYQWQKGSGNISGATAQTFVATKKGSYKVIVTKSNGCTNTSSVTKVTKSCRLSEPGNISAAGEISLQPVPNNGTFTIVFRNFEEGISGRLSVTDLSGRKIYEKEVEIISDQFSEPIMLNDQIDDGIFFVEFVSGESKQVKMMVISRDHP